MPCDKKMIFLNNGNYPRIEFSKASNNCFCLFLLVVETKSFFGFGGYLEYLILPLLWVKQIPAGASYPFKSVQILRLLADKILNFNKNLF